MSSLMSPSTKALVQRAYGEPHRFYHTYEHIDFMMNKANSLNILTPVLEAAIYFHDFNYYIPGSLNEELSALSWIKCAEADGVDLEYQMWVYLMILQTKTHTLPKEDLGIECKYLLDLDMAILAEPWDIFLDYDNKIKKEWVGHASLYGYRLGRLNFLESLRDKILIEEKHIFHTDLFDEDRALSNLNRRVLELLIPVNNTQTGPACDRCSSRDYEFFLCDRHWGDWAVGL